LIELEVIKIWAFTTSPTLNDGSALSFF